MPNTPSPVPEFFAAMQAGAARAEELLSLFAEDAEYIEPFSGSVQTHRGREAIRRAMQAGWDRPLPEVRIEVDRVDVDGGEVVARWTCYSPALPGGSGSGVNRFHLTAGRIARLETRLGNA